MVVSILFRWNISGSIAPCCMYNEVHVARNALKSEPNTLLLPSTLAHSDNTAPYQRLGRLILVQTRPFPQIKPLYRTATMALLGFRKWHAPARLTFVLVNCVHWLTNTPR
jgi:hypothetical protein